MEKWYVALQDFLGWGAYGVESLEMRLELETELHHMLLILVIRYVWIDYYHDEHFIIVCVGKPFLWKGL